MGRSYWFQCPRCGYGVKVCGRADRGVNCFVQTILCRDCKELYDAVYRLRVPDQMELMNRFNGNPMNRTSHSVHSRKGTAPTFQSVINRLPYFNVRHFKWLDFKIICPVSSVHKVEIWTDPGKCPRCGIFLEKNVIPYKVWE